jgi:dihydroxyacid dehydratase/phosphogluconate dehydratase
LSGARAAPPRAPQLTPDLEIAGGVPLVLRRRQEAGLLHEDAGTVTRQTVGEIAAAAVEQEDQDVVRPLSEPLSATGGLAILRGNLVPDGCVVKLAGYTRRSQTGPARVFECEEDAMEAVRTPAPTSRRSSRLRGWRCRSTRGWSPAPPTARPPAEGGGRSATSLA